MENSTNGKTRTDLEKLRTIARGDEAFMLKLIDHFVKETPFSIEIMEASLANHDYAEIGSTAHKIKPSISFTGIPELERDIRRIEEIALGGRNLGELEGLISRFKAGISEVVNDFLKERDRIENNN